MTASIPFSTRTVERQLAELSNHFPIWIEDDYHFVIAGGVKLPPGYGVPTTQLLIEIPGDYPVSPPGIGGSHVYAPPDLRFRGKRLRDLHPNNTPPYPTPGFGPWAWFCYEEIYWDPQRDTLITFLEMVRADLTEPAVYEEPILCED